MVIRLALLIVAVIAFGSAARADSGFAFTFEGIDGKPLSLEQFEGKAVIIVNTASKCGFSYQFEHLETVWRDRKDEGLVIIGVASNDFGGQEPRRGKALANYCERKYGVTFPLTECTVVIGSDAHPFYKWAEIQSGSGARWNFHKYVLGRDGSLVASFPSTVDPRSSQMALAITSALRQSAP